MMDASNILKYAWHTYKIDKERLIKSSQVSHLVWIILIKFAFRITNEKSGILYSYKTSIYENV